METVAIVSAIAGTALSAYGSYRQGQQQSAMASYNSDVAAVNAQAARDNAQAARQKAAYDENIQRERSQRLAGRQRLAYAKAGVDMGEGSPLDFLLQQTEEAEKDALAIRYGGEVAATGYLNQAAGYTSQGNIQSWMAPQYETAGYINAGSTILKGAGNMYQAYNYPKLKRNQDIYDYDYNSPSG